jgi:hypothetical protein
MPSVSPIVTAITKLPGIQEKTILFFADRERKQRKKDHQNEVSHLANVAMVTAAKIHDWTRRSMEGEKKKNLFLVLLLRVDFFHWTALLRLPSKLPPPASESRENPRLQRAQVQRRPSTWDRCYDF